MTIGTKSVLFGAHQFILHPLFVAAAWWKLYGFPWHPYLWISFFVHDLGYIGKKKMEDAEGEKHVELGAKIMGVLGGKKWHDFCLYHSRFYAKKDNAPFSKLCVADKLCIVMTPAWLYIPMARKTGEIDEYMSISRVRAKAGEANLCGSKVLTEREWYRNIQNYMNRWVITHKSGKADTWTPDTH